MGVHQIEVEVAAVLPGRVVLRRGRARDYERLKRFHYRGKRPATWADVWVAEYFRADSKPADGRVVAVGVLSYPTIALHARDEALGLRGMEERARIAFVNRNVRTISRVIVHPQFRSVGLAVALVQCLMRGCNTRYVEALAVMGKAHPFFEKAGMRRIESGEGRPVYYLWERLKGDAPTIETRVP
jgi:ABC-type ATPase with predicted acetyltransferase domain